MLYVSLLHYIGNIIQCTEGSLSEQFIRHLHPGHAGDIVLWTAPVPLCNKEIVGEPLELDLASLKQEGINDTP
jgi:hypothetical protein